MIQAKAASYQAARDIKKDHKNGSLSLSPPRMHDRGTPHIIAETVMEAIQKATRNYDDDNR